MGIFSSSFFSFKGQKERLGNVGATFKAVAKNVGSVFGISKAQNISANVSSPLIKKGLELVSNNPFTTAAVVGTAANIPKAVTLVKKSQAAKAAKKASSSLPGIGYKPANKSGGGIITPQSTTSAATTVAPTAGGGMIKPDTSGVLTKADAGTTVASVPRSSTRRRRARKRTTKRRRSRASRRKRSRGFRRTKSRKKRYGTAKQYARPGGKSVKYYKGRPYIVLPSGMWRWVKK